MSRSILFNSVDLSTITDCVITRITPYNSPRRNLSTLNLSNSDGSKTTAAEYKDKTIVVEGYLEGDTVDEMEIARDTLMQYLAPIEKTLRFIQSGATRIYTGTVSDVTFSESEGSSTTFVITFVCADPFGYDPNYVLETTSNITSLPSNWTITVAGTYNAKPVIQVTLSSPSSATRRLVIGRYSTATSAYLESLWIQKDWTGDTGKTIVVDCLNKTVKMQGVALDYFGVFPEFEIGSQTIRFEGYDTAGAASDFTDLNNPRLTYYKRYL